MKIGILVIAVLFVVMPFLFWRSTWFGLTLSDKEMQESFADTENPRKAQHALTQVAEHMARGDRSVRQWYPQVMAQAGSSKDELRLTAAWVMGQDITAGEFREPLQRLLKDANPMVRHNAALALVRFGDASGHDDIVGMLRPYSLAAGESGVLVQRLQPGDVLNPGTLVARIRAGEKEIEVRSKVPGRLERWLVNDGAAVSAEMPIAEITPSAEMIWEALRALALIGTSEDLQAIEPYTRAIQNLPANIAKQAEETLKSIRSRNP